jgi:hypothetical protein
MISRESETDIQTAGSIKSTDHPCHPVERSQRTEPADTRISCHMRFFIRLYRLETPIQVASHILPIPAVVNKDQCVFGWNIKFNAVKASIAARQIKE